MRVPFCWPTTLTRGLTTYGYRTNFRLLTFTDIKNNRDTLSLLGTPCTEPGWSLVTPCTNSPGTHKCLAASKSDYFFGYVDRELICCHERATNVLENNRKSVLLQKRRNFCNYFGYQAEEISFPRCSQARRMDE